jgi:GMP synthase-like glutamine amidotransferase
MIWIIQNQERVPAGQYDTLLRELDWKHQTVQLHRDAILPELKPGDSVLVLGGTMSYNDVEKFPWLPSLKRFLTQAANDDITLLCICLGAQLLADALGGTVTKNQNQERGISRIHLTEEGRSDPLMTEIPTMFPVMQWHNDSFDLPPQATLLASSSICPVQAFRYRNAYGIQFHPEVNQRVIKTWNATLDPPGYYDKEFAFARPDWQPTWDRLLINFLAVAS